MGSNKLVYVLFYIFFLESAYASNLKIYNDLSKEQEGRVLEVENVVTSENPKSKYKLKIYPEETKELAAGDILKFTVNRVFPSHKVKYQVRCEKSYDDTSITITLKDIHEDKISQGCYLSGYGHWSRRTGTTWTRKPVD